MRVSAGCRALDALLRGGVEPGAITEFYGEAGSGKTTICIQIAREVASHGKRVIYIDTEGISPERLHQICGEEIAKRMLFFEPDDFDEQDLDVEKAAKLALGNTEVGLVVLDSATMHYRVDSAERRSLSNQITLLLKVARRRGIPVVVTSQVYTDVGTNEFKPLGGHVLHHNAKAIVKLEKNKGAKRMAVLMKHRAIPEGGRAEVLLTDKGIEDCESADE